MLLLQALLVIPWMCAITVSGDEVVPPGYEFFTENLDDDSIKYRYGYNIEDSSSGSTQGKDEFRNGPQALGRYYIQDGGSTQNVQYLADDWGFHPYVEYGRISPYSESKAHFIFGAEAIEALRNNQFSSSADQILQKIQHLTNGKSVTSHKRGKALELPASNSTTTAVSIEQTTPVANIVATSTSATNLDESINTEVPKSTVQQEEENIAVKHSAIPTQTLSPSTVTFSSVITLPLQSNIPEDSVPRGYKSNVVNDGDNGDEPVNINSRIINDSSESGSDYDDTVLTEQNLGEFGTKLSFNTKPLITNNVPRARVSTQSSYKYNLPKILIENTRNLVSGQDVLNINDAIDRGTTVVGNSITTEMTAFIGEESTENPSIVNLSQDPIIVAELEDNRFAASTDISTNETTNQIQSVETATKQHILVTPRPVVSTNFLAPIRAGIQMENENYVVDVQKSLPYYLGKFEFVQSPQQQEQQANVNEGKSASSSSSAKDIQDSVFENLELGKTLLSFPQDLPPPRRAPHNYQELPEATIRENFIDGDQPQQESQHINRKVVPNAVDVTEKPASNSVHQQTYPIEGPFHIPYTVEKPVPITVTHVVEKEVPVPQPYPVEKPIHIPVEVTRYVDRPYPVQVPVAHPVPYPVDRVVEKIIRQPYPVEVRVPVEIKVPVPVVDKKPQYPSKHFIDARYPLELPIPVAPQHSYVLPPQLLTPIQLGGTTHTSKTTPAGPSVKFNNHEQVLLKYNAMRTKQQQPPVVPQQYILMNYANAFGHHHPHHHNNPSSHHQHFHPQLTPSISTYQQLPTVNYAAQSTALHPTICDQQQHQHGTPPKHIYYNLRQDDYIGLLPPKHRAVKVRTTFPGGVAATRKYRNARSNFNTNNVRVEYGFMPPLIPSQEIDENGKPIEKSA